MPSRSRSLFFLASLLFAAWPYSLHADQSGQAPQKLSSESFLLVASPRTTDTRFSKTVVLVTRHGNTGPIGIIINRPQNATLDKIFPGNSAAKDFHLFYGGPMFPKQISYLVRGADAMEGALTISGNIYLAYDPSTLGELLNGKRRHKGVRVVHGMASWAPGQLENEIKRGGWFVIPLDEAVIFEYPTDDMWQELLSHAAVM
jgi:putative transcriptional regulator